MISKEEEKILSYWNEIEAFELSNKLSKGKKEYSFYDGPPFATGLPHYGHILSGTIKDTITRFYYQQDYSVERRFGWDCHGLPIEYAIDELYNIRTKQDVERIGVKQYNQYCRNIVMKYSSEWKSVVNRMGRWIDFKNGYKTMDFTFMESVWWVFKELFNKNKIYKGYRVMPYSTKCRTPMSNFEANQNYKETTDITATVRLPLKQPLKIGDQTYKSISFIAWTTTPWTLPSNSALLVNPEMEYCLVQEKPTELLHQLYTGKTTTLDQKETEISKETEENYYVIKAKFALKKTEKPVATLLGKDLVGLEYQQPFQHFEQKRSLGYFRVYMADFVQEGAGTGIVHCAPGFGEEDYNAFVQNKIIRENEEVVCPVNDEGRFTEEVPEYQGQHVKECDKQIVRDLKQKGVLYETTSIVHSYPFCWRSDTPLIYKAVPSWFVNVKDSVKDLTARNKEINWNPEFVGESKFGLWLENARDWAISRNRYWGTPIPIWVREGVTNPTAEDLICIGSAEELFQYTGTRVTDLHKDVVDEIIIVHNNHRYFRTEEVLDCWFESGSVPYGQKHYPFENQQQFKDTFPADFIAEGLDQTRGWFYTLHVLSVLLYDKPAFKNVMVTGLVLAEDGKKMSKRLKNYPDPVDVLNSHGADALRLYMISSTVVKAENLRFTEAGVAGILRELIIPWQNCLRFLKTTSKTETVTTGCEVEDIAQEVSGITITTTDTDDGLMLDLWILQELDEFAREIQKEGLGYRLQSIVPKSIEFIGDLSRWYIRLSRERLRGTSMEILAFVLKSMAIILAPFAPFFSEKVYMELQSHTELEEILKERSTSIKETSIDQSTLRTYSVHYQMHNDLLNDISKKITEVSKGLSVAEVQKTLQLFRKVKSIIESVRILREKNNLSLKMPVKEVVIIGLEESAVMTKILAKESNTLMVSYRTESEYSWEQELVPDFKKISTLYGGSQVQTRAKYIREISSNPSLIATLLSQGTVTYKETEITREEAIYKKSAKNLPENHYGLSTTDIIYTIIDTTKDKTVEDLWIRREVKSAVQKLRKKAGLQITDKALLTVDGVQPDIVSCDANTKLSNIELNKDNDTVSETLTLGTHSISLFLKQA
ncbi:isoleucyl-tRNA synthetase [Nematocida sp. AWRm80]|nr:isoleucyl-tRNA synthetase [Nematocida sp. AWRm80]